MADEPLRILHIYPKDDFYTGAVIQLRDLATGLARRGHRVVVLTRPNPRWRAEAAAGGFRHADFFRTPADPAGAVRLAALLRAERVQVVHAHKGGGRTLTLLARLLGPRPPLVVNRGVSFRPSLATRYLDGARPVARVVAVCEAIKQQLVRAGMPADKIEVIYSGTDTGRFDPARAEPMRIRTELGLAPGAPLVTQIGVRESKGNDVVVRAFARVRAQRPDARLLLVGARPEKREPLAGLVAALDLEAAVTIWGYRDDVPDVLAAADVCVDGSPVGLGITGTLREALAMETPVVATAAMGNPELVVPGRTGLLFRPGDADGLADALLCVLADPGRAREWGRAGRREVLERFSTEVKVSRLEGLYRRVAAA